MTTATAEIARVNGIELGYQTFGSGDPLILPHGGFDINVSPALSQAIIPFLD